MPATPAAAWPPGGSRDPPRRPDPPQELGATTRCTITAANSANPPQAIGATTRSTIAEADLARVRSGLQLVLPKVYIGRGPGSPKGRSVWANPFMVSDRLPRDVSHQKYRNYLEESGKVGEIEALRGKVLVCHCKEDQACHADVLIDLRRSARAAPDVQMDPAPAARTTSTPLSGSFFFGAAVEAEPLVVFIEDGLPVRAGPEVGDGRYPDVEFTRAADVGGGWRGRGPPRREHHMGKDKPYSDGGGLCSPGRWPPRPAAAADRFGQGDHGGREEDHARGGLAVIRRQR